MGNGVRITHSELTEQNRPQTIEHSVKVYGNWSGIHDFNFDSDVSVASIDGSQNFAPAQSGSNSSFVLSFDVDMPQWKIYFTNDNAYTLESTGTNIVLSTSTATLSNVPITLVAGHIEIAVREQSYMSSDKDVHIGVALWNNGKMLFSHTHFIEGFSELPFSVGVVALPASPTYTNFRVPQLAAFVEWSSIDPGEEPAGGYQRTMEGRYVKQFVRGNGQLRAWESSPRDSVKTYTYEDLFGKVSQYDKKELYSHVRVMGAFLWAEHIDQDTLSAVGHRFAEVNSPYLMSEKTSYEGAVREQRRMVEASKTLQIVAYHHIPLELEDRVVVDGESWIVTGKSVNYTGFENVIEQIQLRKYAYE